MNNIYGEVLDHIIFLYERYSCEHRASTQPFHLQKIQKLVKNYQYECHDLLVREPLIEHSGSLPIIATTVYPHINDANVDLGKALIMLAIHDIGEIVVGDEITFLKKTKSSTSEKSEALKILPPEFHETYLEMEDRKSTTARFAKAIDKIAPDIVDLMTPIEITVQRYKIMVNKGPDQIIATIKEFKHPYMIWNDFMKNLHLEILSRLDTKLKPFYSV